MKASPRLIAAHVGNNHALRPSLPTLPNPLRHHLWIGIRSLLRRSIPRDVGLNHHHVLPPDKPPHSAKILHRLGNQRARLSISRHGRPRLRIVADWKLHHRQLRPFLIGPDTMISARPLRLCRHWPNVALAQPHASASRTRPFPPAPRRVLRAPPPPRAPPRPNGAPAPPPPRPQPPPPQFRPPAA